MTHSHQFRKSYLLGSLRSHCSPVLPSPSHPSQGSLLAFCTGPASSELPSSASLDPLTEGADAHLPVPRSLGDVLSTSWFRGHEARPEAMIFSPKGFPGPGHTGRETLDPQGSLIIRNVTTQDAGSYTVVLETSRGRRSATEQIHVKASSSGVPLMTFPGNSQGIIQSELNYSVILQWVASIDPEPVLRWTLNGSLCGTGKKMIIQRLSLKDLGTYVCLAENSEEVYFSQPVTVMLPQANVEPTDPVPIKPNPTLSLSGGSAIALIVVTLVVIMSLVVLSVYTLIHDKRYLPSLTPIHSAAPRPRTRSAARRKPSQQPVPRSFKLISERMTLTPDGPIGLVSSQSGSGEHERVWVFFFPSSSVTYWQ